MSEAWEACDKTVGKYCTVEARTDDNRHYVVFYVDEHEDAVELARALNEYVCEIEVDRA